MTLRLLCMPAQIRQMMAFTQIMDIWRPAGRSMEDHLKIVSKDHLKIVSKPVILTSTEKQIIRNLISLQTNSIFVENLGLFIIKRMLVVCHFELQRECEADRL